MVRCSNLVQDRLDSDISFRSHVSCVLDDVRFSLNPNPARGPRLHRLQIIHDERRSRNLQHIPLLHSVRDVPAAHIGGPTVSVEAYGSNVWPSGLGRCPDSSQRLRFQTGQFFLGEQLLTTLSKSSISRLYGVSDVTTQASVAQLAVLPIS